MRMTAECGQHGFRWGVDLTNDKQPALSQPANKRRTQCFRRGRVAYWEDSLEYSSCPLIGCTSTLATVW